jgi:hypothetical protein
MDALLVALALLEDFCSRSALGTDVGLRIVLLENGHESAVPHQSRNSGRDHSPSWQPPTRAQRTHSTCGRCGLHPIVSQSLSCQPQADERTAGCRGHFALRSLGEWLPRVFLAASQHALEGPIFDTPDAAVLHQFNRQSATIINNVNGNDWYIQYS